MRNLSFVVLLVCFAATIIVCLQLQFVQAGDEFYDNRCICICPSFSIVNEEDTGRKIYISILNKDKCNCVNVLTQWKPNRTDLLNSFCPRCNCNYEVRNTTTMKIVVIIIICVLALLFIYMSFLLCLDPLMSRRTRAYQEQQNEELSMESDDQPFSTAAGAAAPSGRSNVINRVTQEQSKWKRQVQEQRRTVYDRHTLLN